MTQRRWSPGAGFIKLHEYSSVAVWMKPLQNGALLAVYRPLWRHERDDLVEHWIVELPRGSGFHWTVFDKPHRIRWLLNDEPTEPGDSIHGIKIHLYEMKGASHTEHGWSYRRGGGSWRRGHKHMWTNKRVRMWWSPWETGLERRAKIPRKIEAALEPGVKERHARMAYVEKFWARLDGEDRRCKEEHDDQD